MMNDEKERERNEKSNTQERRKEIDQRKRMEVLDDRSKDGRREREHKNTCDVDIRL